VSDLADHPQGAWAQAIEHLAAAEELMAEMDVSEPRREPLSLADVFRQALTTARGAVAQHWRWRLWEEMTRRPTLLVPVEEVPAEVHLRAPAGMDRHGIKAAIAAVVAEMRPDLMSPERAEELARRYLEGEER